MTQEARVQQIPLRLDQVLAQTNEQAVQINQLQLANRALVAMVEELQGRLAPPTIPPDEGDAAAPVNGGKRPRPVAPAAKAALPA